MRPDMKDLLVNTGRAGDYGYQRARFKTTDPDLLPRRFSSAEFIYYKRSTGDRLRPLYRFLEHNCGRPWADVYSEICQVSDHRTIRGYHLLTHVKDYVRPVNHAISGMGSYGPFFVDTDGTLQKERERTNAERQAAWRKSGLQFRKGTWGQEKPANPRVTDTADHWWEKIEGFWYEFTVIHVKDSWAEEFLIDRGNNVVDIGRSIREVVRDRTKKRQVDSKTTKKLEASLAKVAA